MFIETSIQIKRLLSREWMPLVNNQLIDQECVTSTYVWMEFKRTILQDMECLSHIVKSKTVEQVPVHNVEVLEWIVQAGQQFSKRRVDRILTIYSAIMRNLCAFQVERNELLGYLAVIRRSVTEGFFRSPSRTGTGKTVSCVNETACDLASTNVEPENLLTKRMSCRGTEACCKLATFCQGKSSALKEMVQRLRSALYDPGVSQNDRGIYAKIISVYDGLIDDSGQCDFQKLLGEKKCWRFGDVIIAIEASEFLPIFSVDKIFRILHAGECMDIRS